MKQRDSAPQSGINVTPLVDVCLVLLIIFMVVAPMLDRNAVVRLPEARAPQPLVEERGPVLAMRKDGTLWYGQSWLPPREMLAKLKEVRARRGTAPLVLYADAGLTFADVRRTLRLVEEAGFPGVSLAAKKPAAVR